MPKPRRSLTVTLTAEEADRVLRALDAYETKHRADFAGEADEARALRVRLAEQRVAAKEA